MLEEANTIFRQFCPVAPPSEWLHLMMKPHSTDLIDDEVESRIQFLGVLINQSDEPDAEWMLSVISQNHRELERRIEIERAALIASFNCWRNKAEVAEYFAEKQRVERLRSDPSEAPTEAQRKQMDRYEWLSIMEPVAIEREFIKNKDREGPAFALAKLTQAFGSCEGSALEEFTTATSSFLENISSKQRKGEGHDYRDGDYSLLSPLARGIAASIFEVLYARLPPEPERVGPDLKWALQHFALMAFEWGPTPAPEPVAKRLRSLATTDLAGLRSRVRAMGSIDFKQANQNWGSEIPVFDQNIRVILWFGGLSDGLSQLIQILRVLPFPAVGANLTSWGGEANELGSWSLVPNYLVGAIHLHAERRLKNEPTLRKAREALADFCLKRIGQRKGERTPGKVATDETLVEPEPHWRACYLYAARSLMVNPQGKGHEAVYWAKNYDPNLMVREIASEVYPSIKNHREIPDGRSPRRPLITAIWWLLQAHRVALNLRVDEESIQATLSSLVRRTTAAKKPTTKLN